MRDERSEVPLLSGRAELFVVVEAVDRGDRLRKKGERTKAPHISKLRVQEEKFPIIKYQI